MCMHVEIFPPPWLLEIKPDLLQVLLGDLLENAMLKHVARKHNAHTWYKNVYRHGIKKQSHNGEDYSYDDKFCQTKFILFPQEIAQSFQRIHHPLHHDVRAAKNK